MSTQVLANDDTRRTGSQSKSKCAFELRQIAATVEILSKQLDKLVFIDAKMLPRFESIFATPLENFDTVLARKIRECADQIQSEADSEAATVERIFIVGTNDTMAKDAAQRMMKPVCRACEGRGFELVRAAGSSAVVKQDCAECKSITDSDAGVRS